MDSRPANARPPPLVTIVLPAKNEGTGLGRTLRALPLPTLRAMGYATEIFVLDGHSEDGTPRIARQWGATVVLDGEPGKGNALRSARRHFRGDYIVMLDADGTYAPDAIPRLLNPLRRGEADMVMGTRNPLPGSMPDHHRIGNRLLSMVATIFYVRRCPDVCTGLWGFQRSVLRTLPLRSRGFGLEAELFGLGARLRLRVARVPVDYLPRRGQAKLSSRRDGVRILRRLLSTRVAPLTPVRPLPLEMTETQAHPTSSPPKVHA